MAMMVLMSMMLVSCDCCEEEKTVDFDFTYTCSEDLLKQVTPVISYTDENGTPQTLELTPDMLSETNTTSVEHKGFTMTVQGKEGYVWQKSLHFDDFGVSSEMTVSYILRPDAEEITDKSYVFMHDLACSILAQSDHVNTVDTELTMTVGVQLGADAAKQYIQELLTQKDHRRVTVDKDGKSIREK